MIDENRQLEIQKLGEEILQKMESQTKSSIFSKDFWYGSIMDWSMKNPSFKVNMFRFVDVLPVLKTNDDLIQHIKEYFTSNGEKLPAVMSAGLGLGSLAPGIMASAIKKNVIQMAKMFIAGESPQDIIEVLKKSRKNSLAFTVDILGEATLSEIEGQAYLNKYLQLMEDLQQAATSWPEIPLIDRDHLGPIPKINISVKMTALTSLISDKAWEPSKNLLKNRLRPLFKKAIEKNIFLNLDMEHYAVKNLTLEVFTELLQESEFGSYPFFGCVIQAYLKDSESDIQRLVEFAKQRQSPFTIRLVKGAYWDSETVEAHQKGWPIPVYTNKAESDTNFERCAVLILNHYPHLRLALASHNVRSIAATLIHAQYLQIPNTAFELQMLYGMADPIKKTMVAMGYRVREYAPMGDLLPGMAYLVRRLLENTSNQSWLRRKFADSQSNQDLLQDPSQHVGPSSFKPAAFIDNFQNEPLLDFTRAEHRLNLQKNIEVVLQKTPYFVASVIDGKTSPKGSYFLDTRKNPSDKQQVIAQVQWADVEQAEKAIQSAQKFWHSWTSTNLEERCQKLEALAHLMKKRRYELIALQVVEVGKPWAEADGDVAEAIDFCLYYALQARKTLNFKNHSLTGEDSQTFFRSRGVCAVIAPWNFPLAILCGMTVAALVAGNTVVLKPAEQSSLIAFDFMQMLLQVGFPHQAIHFLPGKGEEVGAYLVQHPIVATIAFTGSRKVGEWIFKTASVVNPEQDTLKKCLLELGGKNAIIVDNDADLDEAIDGILYSAFGFSGQKCSAASRVIAVGDIYESLKERLLAAADSYKILEAHNPQCDLGPVIDAESQKRILDCIADAEKQYPVLFKTKLSNEFLEKGYYVPATIFTDVPADSSLAQEEIFGPVVAIIPAKDFNEALKIANNTRYGLTGGVFSRSPLNIQKAKNEFRVGNLYINRGITGALVQRHPFGGFKLSGTDSKAGGPDYVKLFTDSICIAENTLRRGFTPEVD